MLNKVALSVQVNMKADLREIYGALTCAAAEAAVDVNGLPRHASVPWCAPFLADDSERW